MRVTLVGDRRPAARGAADGACADADVDFPASAAPTTPVTDFAKLRRSIVIWPRTLWQRVRHDFRAVTAADCQHDVLLAVDLISHGRAGLLRRHLDRAD